ncbi:hypothetical protein UFOVP53_123 [uncultured Caudovirales phage]|uniref:Uncharacterized protein n=1 Tax=uncultured Caudovirales phage TaxID=2100421 RepID=A0A6J5KZK7_9CAUD|nr:hypothetical protein UFOVP53_123 [uncultured Caudovirales phage]
MGIEYLSETRNQREIVIKLLDTLGKFNIIKSRILYLSLKNNVNGYKIRVEFYGK